MFDLILAQAQAPAGPAQPQPSPVDALMSILPMLIVMGVIFYLLIWRPESQRRKKREEMLGQLKRKDEVSTIGGIIGTIEEINGDEVTLLVDRRKDVRLRFRRGAIEGISVSPQSEKEAKEAGKEQKG